VAHNDRRRSIQSGVALVAGRRRLCFGYGSQFSSPSARSFGIVDTVARRPLDTPETPLEFIDDGLTDDARAAAMEAWLADLDCRPPISLGVRAVDALAEARAQGEV